MDLVAGRVLRGGLDPDAGTLGHAVAVGAHTLRPREAVAEIHLEELRTILRLAPTTDVEGHVDEVGDMDLRHGI